MELSLHNGGLSVSITLIDAERESRCVKQSMARNNYYWTVLVPTFINTNHRPVQSSEQVSYYVQIYVTSPSLKTKNNTPRA